jgi:uncharacterized protein (DUF1778 family)
MSKTRPRRLKSKETRLNVRVNAEQKAVIARGARLSRTTMSNFVLDNALQAASHLIAEETHVQMTPQQFEDFCRLLDAPPSKNLKAMRKLLNQPSLLDG